MAAAHGNIAWVPCHRGLAQNRLFDISATRDNAIERFVKAKELLDQSDYISNTIDSCDLATIDVVIFYGVSSELRWLLQAIKHNPQVRLINIPIEPPVVSPLHDEIILSAMPFDRILVWNDKLARMGLPFVKATIGEAFISEESIPRIAFERKKFLAAIYSNKMIKHLNGLYEERERAFNFFSGKPDGLDLYGVGWEKDSRTFIRTSYRGSCESKKDVLKNYKFSICFENATGYPGLVTEKIFDCFAAGVVPIYYGAPNIQEYIPRECFIDFRDFSSYEELYRFLVELDEVGYQAYLDAVKEFLRTPAYYEFTSGKFAELVLAQLEQVLKEPARRLSVIGFKWALVKAMLGRPVHFMRNINRCRRFLFDLATVW